MGEDDRPEHAEPPLGAAVFATRCKACHAGGAETVAAELVGTDPEAAKSRERGGDGYRVPALFRVAERTRLTHEGRFASLQALFDPARASTDRAHPFGLDLDAEHREALLEFLRVQ